MKNSILSAAAALLLFGAVGCSQSEDQKMAELYGVEMSNMLNQQIQQVPGFDKLDKDDVLDAFSSDLTSLTFEQAQEGLEDMNKYIMSYVQSVQGDTSFVASAAQVDSVEMFFGRFSALQILGSMDQSPVLGALDLKSIASGFKSGASMSEEELTASREERVKALEDYFKPKFEAELAAQNAEVAGPQLEAGKAFLEENAKREGVVVTESGLQYEILEEGTGEIPNPSSKVTVDYIGTLIDGTVFDQSVGRAPFSYTAGSGVIQGWIEGVQLMTEGSKFKLFIPQDLAYGFQDKGTIKPGSTLIFEITLIKVEN